MMVITSVLRNIKESGFPLRVQVYHLLGKNIVALGLSDAAMVGSTALSLPLQRLYRNGPRIFHWQNAGFWIQSIYQLGWLALWTQWPFILGWTWTAQVFFALHTLTFLMKMHSYAFYNGHLVETERRLQELDHPKPDMQLNSAFKYPSSPSRVVELDEQILEKQETTAKLGQLRKDLALELTSPMGQVTYPENLTIWNYVDYTLCPTLCYELEYPRTSHIRWLEVFYKTLAVFGCIFLMTIISEEFITPILANSALRLRGMGITDQALIMAETTSTLLFPFMIILLLVFLVIWEYVLGAFAELTCFADRHFYSDWWNSTDWLEFSREWNIPVYHFLRRHVYFSMLNYTSNSVAMAVTFLVSALGHELIMGCITKKLRGYGFFMMMMQLPIVAIQRSPLLRGNWVLNNAAFWSSIVLGLAMLCSLYVLL